MKKKYKLAWLIIRSGIEKYFLKNFEMYAPSVAGKSILKGRITMDNIIKIFPLISLMISKLGIKNKIVYSKSFCNDKTKLKDAIRLKKLFNFYGSDKSKFHDYHFIYSSIFKKPNKVKKILEIGIGTNDTLMLSNMGKFGKPGASLKAYRDFFKKSKIYGADIDKKILFKDKRIITKYVNQTDYRSIKELFKLCGDSFDLIIDDGLHSHIANLNFFIYSLDFLKKGGCYIIEDISLKSKSIWLTISTIISFKHKCFLIKCKRSYVFLIYK